MTLLDSDSDLSLNCLDADPSDDDEDDATNEKKEQLVQDGFLTLANAPH